jgi:hypothetical protein
MECLDDSHPFRHPVFDNSSQVHTITVRIFSFPTLPSAFTRASHSTSCMGVWDSGSTVALDFESRTQQTDCPTTARDWC